MKRLFFCVILFLTAGCNRGAPHNVRVSEEKFAQVYAELTDSGEQGKIAGYSRVRARQGADSVLQNAGVSREQFLAVTAWLNDDVTRWRGVTEEVVRILEARAIRSGTPR